MAPEALDDFFSCFEEPAPARNAIVYIGGYRSRRLRCGLATARASVATRPAARWMSARSGCRGSPEPGSTGLMPVDSFSGNEEVPCGLR
ncbi:hypothetical protein SAMN05442782_11023 [Streptomyces sp. OK228]|nr:hypothetical protein SAMN05442782_11023 [Streptomyces sp. OK228]